MPRAAALEAGTTAIDTSTLLGDTSNTQLDVRGKESDSMAKARAIVKRRKAVKNIRKITKTMQMIATAKFQKSLKRAVGTKPYTKKVRELVGELAATVGNVEHPLLRRPGHGEGPPPTNRIGLVVITSNRGLAGAYNGSVIRTANHFIREQEAAGKSIDLYVAGKKGYSYFNFQKRPIVQRLDQFGDLPRFADVDELAKKLMDRFTDGELDAVYVAFMNFVSAGSQKPEVVPLLPLASLTPPAAAGKAGQAQTSGVGELDVKTQYDFYPDAMTLLDELLPLTVKSTLFQAFLDAVTSENVARMVAMKSATDNADKMIKSLTMQYNRARQSQITTELSEIMGGVEAMKA
jgi:F-type H+-transporting ATPase subunit gamma